MSDYKPQPFRDFKIEDGFKHRDIRAPRLDAADLARRMADFNEKTLEAMARLVEAIEALHILAEIEPDEETLMTLLEAKRESQKHKTHPCPYNPPKRPAKAARAVKQFYPHSKSRPQARSHIKRRGDRRRT